MVSDDDWRLMGQEKYLAGVRLQWRKWWSSRPPDAPGPWDHDHCEFCTDEFAAVVSEHAPLDEGWTTKDGAHWICATCFEDFRSRFGWVVEGSAPDV
ncbi:MAG: hypothetical protein QOJ29_5446 [Thermoleophilaceae bacterium]|jgi:hypothetical protein|nr:hypothetical protein [Thermoleophilaceae bacterium]